MEVWQILGLIAAILILFLGKGIYDKIHQKKKLYASLKEGYGQLPENQYDLERYKYISYYFEHKAHSGDVIDDITWNDLDMEMVFMTLNHTCTGIGEEYLYAMLHEPSYNTDMLRLRDERAAYFDSHESVRIEAQFIMKQLGKLRRIGIFQYLDLLREAPKHNPALNIFLCFGIIASVIISIVKPSYWALVFIFAATNISLYATYRNKVYFSTFAYMSNMIQCADRLCRMDIPVMGDELREMQKLLKPFVKISRRAWLFRQGSGVGGTLLDLLMDYIKMLLHIDLIMFDFTLSVLRKNDAELDRLMAFIGELDSDIAIASYRKMKGVWCRPKLYESSYKLLKADGLYHPLIGEPVPNSIHTDSSVLLTGSNASGKSTFLKTVAINAILAQTIDTALADAYEANFFRVYSSMALKDNLMANESYFIVEIKSLKRIVEQAGGRIPMLCFIDEVLRGTNTVERIAASSQILNKLGKMNTLCFAATHDIELAGILADSFENYHFQEEVVDNEVIFDYKLRRGRAVSRNAIKLLGIIGFGQDIIDKAEKSSRDFEANGVWKL